MSPADPEPRRQAVVERLRSAGCVFAEDEADLLLAEAGDDQTSDDQTSDDQTGVDQRLETMIIRRVEGEPLEQVLGWAEFCGLRLRVAQGVFVPRLRTSLLVAEAARRCRSGDVVIDLCTGVGAIAAALADRIPGLELYATDVDPVAVDCARTNLGQRAAVSCGDLYAPLPRSLSGRVSMITANAPYVPTAAIAYMPSEARDHEARAALDGGADGLELHRRIISGVRDWLAEDGVVAIETGRDRVEVDLRLLTDAGLSASVITDDEIGGTVVIGQS